MKITLNESEFFQAAQVGMMRQLKAIRRNRRPVFESSDTWGAHIEGACGELAVAKFLNVFWNGTVDKVGLPDVGEFEVRTTARNDGPLYLYEKDKPESVFILITGRAPEFTLVGYLLGSEGMQPEYWWENPPSGVPCWAVPQERLIGIENLAYAIFA